MPTGGAPRTGARSQRWSTFVRNQADTVLACDFFVAISATFRVFYVFVVLERVARARPERSMVTKSSMLSFYAIANTHSLGRISSPHGARFRIGKEYSWRRRKWFALRHHTEAKWIVPVR